MHCPFQIFLVIGHFSTQLFVILFKIRFGGQSGTQYPYDVIKGAASVQFSTQLSSTELYKRLFIWHNSLIVTFVTLLISKLIYLVLLP
jgi:hypothetical protein